MERLTVHIGDTVGMAWEHEEKHSMDEWVDMLQTRLAEYEDTGLSPEEIKAALELKDTGRLLVLPCPVGTPVYVHDTLCHGPAIGTNPDCMYSQDCPRHSFPCPLRVVKKLFSVQMHNGLGRSFWLTQEEAEAAIPPERRNRRLL